MEVKRDEEDRRLHHNNSYQEGNGMMEGVEKNEEIVRRQMQIQEDVSIFCVELLLLSACYVICLCIPEYL